MRDREIDDVLKCAAGVSPEVDRELLGRIAGNLGASLQPVRPVSSVSAFVAALVVVCVATASVSATILGLHGIYALGAVRIALIFPILVALFFLAALVYAGEIVPAVGLASPLRCCWRRVVWSSPPWSRSSSAITGQRTFFYRGLYV